MCIIETGRWCVCGLMSTNSSNTASYFMQDWWWGTRYACSTNRSTFLNSDCHVKVTNRLFSPTTRAEQICCSYFNIYSAYVGCEHCIKLHAGHSSGCEISQAGVHTTKSNRDNQTQTTPLWSWGNSKEPVPSWLKIICFTTSRKCIWCMVTK